MYVADSYNHRVRMIDLKDVPDEVVVETETFTELVARAIRENFMFIVLLVGGIIFGTTFTYCCCRCCSFCPLYQKRLHRKRMNSMKIGNRA